MYLRIHKAIFTRPPSPENFDRKTIDFKWIAATACGMYGVRFVYRGPIRYMICLPPTHDHEYLREETERFFFFLIQCACVRVRVIFSLDHLWLVFDEYDSAKAIGIDEDSRRGRRE